MLPNLHTQRPTPNPNYHQKQKSDKKIRRVRWEMLHIPQGKMKVTNGKDKQELRRAKRGGHMGSEDFAVSAVPVCSVVVVKRSTWKQ
jgi:hypothetical protein